MRFPFQIEYRGGKYILAPLRQPKFTRRFFHDWERDDWKGATLRPNLPEVFRCGELNNSNIGHYVELTRDWQFFWFDVCSKAYYGRYHNALSSSEYLWLARKLTAVGSNYRAFTNNHGLDVFRNYLLDTGKGKENPAIYTLVCGGHTTRELSTKENNKGWKMLEIPSFDGSNPPPDIRTIDIKNDPRIFLAVNITTTKVSTGGYKITPFPQFKRMLQPQDVPVILLSYEKLYFPAKWTESIKSDTKINPYNPPNKIFQNYPY